MALAGKTKQDVLHEFRQAEILDAAKKIFANKGFTDASMEEIAAQAGIAKGTLYLYFSSKRDVYIAAFQKGLAELRERTQAEIAGQGTVRDKLRTFVQSRLRFVEESRDFCRIYHSEFGNVTHPGAPNHEMREHYEQQLALLEELLRAGVSSGEIREIPVAAAATAIYEMTRGWMLHRILGGTAGEPVSDGEILLDILWKGIGR